MAAVVQHPPQLRIKVTGTTVGVALLLGLALLNSRLADTTGFPPVSHVAQFSFFYMGVGLVIYGLGGGWPGVKALTAAPFWRRDVLPLAALLLLALSVRVWQLGERVRVLVDELSPITDVMSLWEQPDIKILRPMGLFSPFPRLYASWQAASIAVFGRNLLGLRMPSAILGTITVLGVYALAHPLFGRRTALIAALLLATYPPHVHFSRIGLLTAADPCFGVWALAALAIARKTGGRLAWALAGGMLGLTQYFYEGGRLLYPTLAGLWLGWTVVRGRTLPPGWWIGASAACLIAFPVYATLLTLDTSATTRLGQMRLDSAYWTQLLTAPPSSPLFQWFVQHITQPAALFISTPEGSPYYGGDRPLILFYWLPAFFLGLGWSLRVKGGGLLWLWLLLTWGGNILLADSALAPRFVVVFPAIALVLAVGIAETSARWLSRLRPQYVYGLVIVGAALQLVYYFGPHLALYNQQIRQGMDAHDAVFRAAELPSGTQVYLIGGPTTMTQDYAQTLLRFLNEQVTITLMGSFAEPQLAAFKPGQAYAFFIAPDDALTIARLRQYFLLEPPQASLDPIPLEQMYRLYRAVRR
jgi:4-amino-4-deoxy-L-arabinose transferase-like glycosyltransferase